MVLPYKGYLGNQVLKGFTKNLYNILSKRVVPRITFRSKTGSFFPVKDGIAKDHLSDLIYHYKCDNTSISNPIEDYIGETGVRLGNRSDEHAKTDKQSSIYKHIKDRTHPITPDNFTILNLGYQVRVNRKIAEVLYIKDKKPSLNDQLDRFKLKLFN